MALIYLHARRVLAWIGRDDGAKTASRLIKELRTKFEEVMEDQDDLYLRDVMDTRHQADLEYVVRMFEKPLFSRVWIIQELGVARDITFLYGDFEIDWIDLFFFVNCMCGSQDLYQLQHFTDYEKIYSAFRASGPSFCEKQNPPDYLDVLLMARNYDASEPRDHVFALLGHPSAYIGDSAAIRADHTKPVSCILTQLTLQLLRQCRSLRPLSAIHHEKLDLNNDSPSWVPALHQALLVAPFGRLEAFGLTMTAGLFEWTAAEDDIAHHHANFAAYLTKVREMQRNTRRSVALGQEQGLPTVIRNEALNGDEYQFVRDANVTWSGRNFFCTGRGFFGLGPKLLRKEDLCCVLFGARVPFILRKTKNHYILIGECYLHGIMRGEAIDMWRNGDLQAQEFELH